MISVDDATKIDHIVLSPNLPIRTGQNVFEHSISGDDYLINDWYYSYYCFVLSGKKADGSDCAAGDLVAIASDSASLIRKIQVNSNGKEIYDSDDLNYYMVTKNILKNSKEYGNSIGTTSLFYPRTVRGTDINEFTTDATTHAVESRNATFHENYKNRVTITKNGDIECIVDLRNCEFFASFYDQIMPSSKLDIFLTITSDDVIIHRAATDAAVVAIKNV